jgi:hypothetical protein
VPVRCHPVDFVTDRVPTGSIRPPVRVHRLGRFEHHVVGRFVEQLLDISVHSGPVLLQRHAIMATAVTDRTDDVRLRPHGIHRDQSAFQIEVLQQQRDGGDLVGFLLGCLYPCTICCRAAQADTRCNGLRPLRLSWLCRELGCRFRSTQLDYSHTLMNFRPAHPARNRAQYHRTDRVLPTDDSLPLTCPASR